MTTRITYTLYFNRRGNIDNTPFISTVTTINTGKGKGDSIVLQSTISSHSVQFIYSDLRDFIKQGGRPTWRRNFDNFSALVYSLEV